jgi:hypothetical protein
MLYDWSLVIARRICDRIPSIIGVHFKGRKMYLLFVYILYRFILSMLQIDSTHR